MITIRPATPDDAETIAHLHRQAVQELAKDYYSLEERESWSPPVDQGRIDKVLNEMKEAIMIVADNDGIIAGFGSIIPSKNELGCVEASKTGTSLVKFSVPSKWIFLTITPTGSLRAFLHK